MLWSHDKGIIDLSEFSDLRVISTVWHYCSLFLDKLQSAQPLCAQCNPVYSTKMYSWSVWWPVNRQGCLRSQIKLWLDEPPTKTCKQILTWISFVLKKIILVMTEIEVKCNSVNSGGRQSKSHSCNHYIQWFWQCLISTLYCFHLPGQLSLLYWKPETNQGKILGEWNCGSCISHRQ